jgi:hypothetical protein
LIRGEDAVVAMPMLSRQRHEVGEPVEEPKQRGLDDATVPRLPSGAAGRWYSPISFEPAPVYLDGDGWRDRTNYSSLKESDASPVGS